jgi:hypothetical protein
VVVISFSGVGSLSELIGGAVFGKSHIGDSQSAYMRDENWTNILTAFDQAPIILVTGGPVASLIDSNIAPMFHWADNQFLWDAYHLGIAGSLAIVFYLYRAVRAGVRSGRTHALDVLVICMLFVIGEGIARESLTFMGCMPLFVACGYVTAAEAAARRSSPERKRKSRHPQFGQPREIARR